MVYINYFVMLPLLSLGKRKKEKMKIITRIEITIHCCYDYDFQFRYSKYRNDTQLQTHWYIRATL